jgi:hypothetical protein
MMAEQHANGLTGAAPARWGSSPQEAFVAVLNNIGKGQRQPRWPVRDRGFVVLVRNTVSLQAVQGWCLQQSWNDCLAARYRITKPAPIFGTLFAALSDDSSDIQDGGLSGRKPHGSVLFRPDSDWPDKIRKGLFRDLINAFSGGDRGETSARNVLIPMSTILAAHTGWRLVLLAECAAAPDLSELEAAKTGLFKLLPERMGLVLAGDLGDFSLPEDDPHYLTLDLEGVEAPDSAHVPVYQLRDLAGDRPSHTDQLGVQRYADALAQFVLHPGTRPLTVAIHGPWGKGKSTFMQLVQQSLLRDSLLRGAAAGTIDRQIAEAPFDADGRLQRPEQVGRRAFKRALHDVQQRVVTVWFNAWRYQDSTQIWAGLASVITGKLEKALPWWRRLLTPIAQAWRTRRAQLITELLLPAGVALLILVLAALGIPSLVNWLNSQLTSNALAKLLGAVVPAVGAVVASFWIVASQARRVLQPVSERVLAYIRRPDYREEMGYQHKVLDDVQFVRHRLCGDRTEFRVFVFIDDLDRCPTGTVMEILQAINLILGESDFYVFLGIETEMIYRAIVDAHRASDGGAPLGRRFAETYLQKIVQLPFHLPETPEDQRASFVADMFSVAAREESPDNVGGGGELADGKHGDLQWDREVIGDPGLAAPTRAEDTSSELKAFLDFLPDLSDNPREIKRLVNIHRFVKIVLQGQGRPAPVEKDQRKLVKWLIFCDRWPDLIDEVLEHVRHTPDCENPIADLVERDSEAGEFASKTSPDDVLTAADLAPHGPFAQAASISHLIVWKSTPQHTSNDDDASKIGETGDPAAN